MEDEILVWILEEEIDITGESGKIQNRFIV